MNRLSRLLPVYRLCSRPPARTQYPVSLGLRYQPRYYAELPRVKQPGEGKGPISWKTAKYIVITGAVLFGALKYLEAQKDAGTYRSRNQCVKIAW